MSGDLKKYANTDVLFARQYKQAVDPDGMVEITCANLAAELKRAIAQDGYSILEAELSMEPQCWFTPKLIIDDPDVFVFRIDVLAEKDPG